MACVTNRLVFDPTDANSVAASSKVGSYVLAGDDGTAIGHTGDALKVDVTALSASDVDIRDLVFATDKVDVSGSEVSLDAATLAALETVTVEQGTSPWVIGDGGGSITVDAVDLDIRDLTAASDSIESWVHDGTGTAIGSTGGALDVNVTNSIDIDDDLADTAIQNEAVAVSTTAVNAVTSALSGRKWLGIANEGNKSLYFGQASVTTAIGFPLHPGMQQVWRIGPSVTPQIIGGAGSSSEDLRNIQLS